MKTINSIIKRIYPSETIEENKFSYSHIYITNSKFLYKRNLEGLKLVLNFYDEPIKKLFTVLSILIPLPLKNVQYLKLSKSDIVFIKVGKSSRVKVFYKKKIENYSINESDYLFTKDLCYRKTLRNSLVSPKVFEVRDGFFSEERLNSVPFNEENDLDKIFNCLYTFYEQFKSIDKSGIQYIKELCAANEISYNLLSLENKDIPQTIRLVRSHGDFWPDNILKTNENWLLIDFEFASYRSFYFDAFYFHHTSKVSSKIMKPYLPIEYKLFFKKIFLLERLTLLNYLYKNEYGDHSNSIALILDSLKKSNTLK